MIRKIFDHMVINRRKEIESIIFFYFLLSFIMSRIIVWGIENDNIPFIRYIYIRGVHIHHFAFGIFFLAIAGFIAIAWQKYLKKTAIIYGMGLGLTFDEFGIWLHLNEEYWLRTSYDAIIIITLFFINLIYLKTFWKKCGKCIKKIIP